MKPFMQRRAAKYLWDAAEACGLTIEFVQGRTFAEYERDPMLRSAVERQLSIVGEALNRFRQLAPEDALRLSDLAAVIAFRNVLVHDYSDVNRAAVWAIATERVTPLNDELQALLREATE